MFLSHDGNSLLCNHRTNLNSDSVNFTVVRRNSSGWIDNITVGIEKTANAGQTHWATDSSGACILFSNSITNSNYGGVSTFNYNNGLWQRQPQKVYEPGRTGNSEQGKWVAMSGDGRTMAYVGIADSIPKVWIYYWYGQRLG